jgi:hypothetical protein
MKKTLSAWFASALAFLFAAISAQTATITVNSSTDSGGTCPGANCTLRQAIANAASGDTIIFDSRVSVITLTTDELLISKNLAVRGPGASLLSIQRSAAPGIPQFRIFEIGASVNATISDLTITNGSSSGLGDGGGLYNRGTISITGCAISGNSGSGADNEGGGLFNATSSTMTLTNCTLSGNSDNFGGAIYNVGTLTLTGSTVSGNTTGDHGAGIYTAGGTTTITNSTITNNQASAVGGGIYSGGGTINLKNTIVALNTALSGDPDIFGNVSSQGYNLIGNATGATITGTTTGNQLNANPNVGPLQDNGGPTKTHALLSGSPAIDGGISGGATTDQRGFARPVDDPAIANASGGDGSDIGAFEVQPDQLPGCASLGHVVGNINDAGPDSLRAIMAGVCSGTTITFAPSVRGTINLTSGELLINKSLIITGPGANLLTIQRSPTAGTNFRIFHINGNFNASISGLTIAKGFSPGNLGGGISNDNGTLTLDSVTVSGNTADIGAGIYTARAATISNSTISENTVSGNIAGDGGGGIYNQGGTLNLINSTLSGNVAQIPSGGGGQGGGIRNNLGTVSIMSTTIAGNSADQGGGIYHNNGGGITFQNSIIAQNTSANGADLNGTFSSGGFNLIGNSTGAILNPALFSDQIGNAGSPLNPGLAPLQDNGGPTFTRALLSGSPAIDKGNASGSSKDQRGLPRPVDFSFISNANTGDGSDIGALEVQPGTILANISTRLRVETGDNALIGGFIVTGTQPKRVILLAIGPSLPLADTLANPTLELYSGNTLLQSNDDWVNSPDKQAIIDSGVVPTNNLESAIVATLPANSSQYTAIVRGASNTTGIGVVQAYDLDRLVDSKLANISTRGLVQTGDNVLIAGTIILGATPQKVIVRAIGPSLPFAGVLADPTLELRDGNGGLIDSNDNWKQSPDMQAIIDSTIPPPNDAESAVVQTLPANGAQYTAIVRGVGGTTGIAVVEIFALN